MYELVDLWAEGLDTSYTSFLQMCFKNIAEWEQDENGGYWKFSALTDVATIGESFDEAKAAAEKLRDEKLAHAKQAATIAKNVVAMEALRDAQVRGMAMARLSLTKAQDMISKLEDELAELDDEEADLRRTLAGGGLSASEEEAVRRRLNEIEQERIRLKLTILEREEQELLQKLERSPPKSSQNQLPKATATNILIAILSYSIHLSLSTCNGQRAFYQTKNMRKRQHGCSEKLGASFLAKMSHSTYSSAFSSTNRKIRDAKSEKIVARLIYREAITMLD